MAAVLGRSGGRNAKTTQEHALHGTLRSNRHQHESPMPPQTVPDPPERLTGDAAKEWTRMIHRLEVSGSLTSVDDAAVYQYCRLYAETERLARERRPLERSADCVAKQLSKAEGAELVAIVEQIVKLQTQLARNTDQLRNARLAIRVYLVEFGMTPAARSRVKLPKSHGQAQDRIARLLAS